ncbi:MAG TPA: YihY/virulence factor BrkB family protein [Gemmatimonadales bacterium]|nr:YihY/virulence factor BrkB family protein [Gemmatimonadales bacterium]
MPFVLLLLIGLTHLAQALEGNQAVDAAALFHRFFPPHVSTPGQDPFGAIERLLVRVSENRGQISLYAVPAFVWFSTRLFAGIRTALNEIYDISARPAPPRHFLLNLLYAKLRDIGMVVATVLLFLANTAMTAALTLIESRGVAWLPELTFFLGSLGRLLAELLAFGFSVSLFYITYAYASPRRLPWRTVLLAATFTAAMFEVAKRLYGLYLANFASFEGPSGDANVGAAVLLILWIHYTSVVFLLGGVVAETWELRKMQQRQRARLA